MTARFDYPAHLEVMWQKHLLPRLPEAPTVVSTFAGCGGSSLGYSMAGYDERLAVEWDTNAVASFRLNFPHVPIHHGDIGELSVEQALNLSKLQPGELDVFDGSPPCQGFSTAGKRELGDNRNQLFRQYVRLLRGFRPRAFVMENVSGMVKGSMKLIFAEILRELRASGYRVEARLLCAMYFHVPQARWRLIFIGIREDLGIAPSHPRAESAPIALRDAIPDLLGMQTRNALFKYKVFPNTQPAPTGLAQGPKEYAGLMLGTTDGFKNGTSSVDKPARSLRAKRPLQILVASRSQNINPWMPADGPAATLCKNHSGYAVLVAEHPPPPPLSGSFKKLAPSILPGQRLNGSQSLVRQRLDRPAGTPGATNRRGFGTPLHPIEHRSLTIEEAKRISSFPDAFQLTGSFTEQWARIGNSVPPLFMEAIARHLRTIMNR